MFTDKLVFEWKNDLLDKLKGTLWGGMTSIYKHFATLTKTQISHKHLEENQHPIYTIHSTTEIMDLVGKSAHLNLLEKYNVYVETKYNNQLKAQNTLEKLHLQSFVPTRSISKASSPGRPTQQYVSFYVIQKNPSTFISSAKPPTSFSYSHSLP